MAVMISKVITNYLGQTKKLSPSKIGNCIYEKCVTDPSKSWETTHDKRLCKHPVDFQKDMFFIIIPIT
jgi:hypothetical protein